MLEIKIITEPKAHYKIININTFFNYPLALQDRSSSASIFTILSATERQVVQ